MWYPDKRLVRFSTATCGAVDFRAREPRLQPRQVEGGRDPPRLIGIQIEQVPLPVTAPYFRDPRETRHVVATRNFDEGASAELRRVALAMWSQDLGLNL